MRVSLHKMAYPPETSMQVWNDNSLSSHAALNQKGKSVIVEQSSVASLCCGYPGAAHIL